jgi:hypothetical protein
VYLVLSHSYLNMTGDYGTSDGVHLAFTHTLSCKEFPIHATHYKVAMYLER